MIDPEVLRIFMAETDKIIAGLKEAVGDLTMDKIPEMHRLAHTLKGNAAQFGQPELSEASKSMEYLARDIGAGEKKLDDSKDIFKQQFERMEGLCQKLRS